MIGFDYGTSNCAVGVMQNGKPALLELAEHGKYMSSTLYAPSRDIISNWLYQRLAPSEKTAFAAQRKLALQKGQAVLRELALDGINSELSFGQQALANYLAEPDEGYYVKSPKSFLGASGLQAQQIALFEDIVAAMMSHVKNAAEQRLQRDISHAVIGRPVNFQGLNGEQSNRQAIAILENAAKRVGFKQIAFQYEPVAAGLEFETQLDHEQRVLIVDIGGGTSDCSMILMGPKYLMANDRSEQLLSHSGERIGGNDFDIQLTLKAIMPQLGSNSQLQSGKPVPVHSFHQAAATNNIVAQNDFYSAENGRYLQQLYRDAKQQQQLARLLKVQQQRLSYHLVNDAEQAKIALSHAQQHRIDLDYLDPGLCAHADTALLQSASQRELANIAALMQDAVTQAGCTPDIVFVTGGTAKSPMISNFIRQQFPDSKLVIGDHFGSVTAGLTRWAERIFR